MTSVASTGVEGPAGAGRLLVNLWLLSLLGVGVSVWVWFYTEWFPVVASLLGLGGVFTWLAFLSGLLPKVRKEQLQDMLDRRVFASAWLPPALFVLFVLVAVAASLFGAVVVRSTSDGLDRTVVVTAEDAGGKPPGEPPRRRRLLPRSERTLLVWTGWSARSVWLRVSGLPPAALTLRPFERAVVEVPSSFRSAVAITASPRVARNLERTGHVLVASRNGDEIDSRPAGEYRGQAAWLGPAPEGAARSGALVVAPGAPLVAGDRLVVEVRRPDGGVYVAGEVEVPPAATESAVAEIVLKPEQRGEIP